MYRQIIVPTEKNHTIELPEKFFGKKVEVSMVILSDPKEKPVPPEGKPVSLEKLFETFGANPEFPDLDTIRAKAWPSKW
jgi:hypothetical protein